MPAHAPGPSPAAAPDSRSTAPPEIDVNDPVAVWAALIDRIGQRALSWLRFLEIDRLESDRVELRIVPGHREVIGFCTDQRLEQIGEHLAPIIGRRVRVHLQRPGTAPERAETGNAPASSSQRREAMNLPLVQRVLEVFPDATLIDARDESEPPATPPKP